jgi:hypothetical protein
MIAVRHAPACRLREWEQLRNAGSVSAGLVTSPRGGVGQPCDLRLRRDRWVSRDAAGAQRLPAVRFQDETLGIENNMVKPHGGLVLVG